MKRKIAPGKNRKAISQADFVLWFAGLVFAGIAPGMINSVSADQFSHSSKYHELIFQAEFSSNFPQYPHAGNKQQGTIYAYKKHAQTSAKKRFKSLAPASLKQAVVAETTPNPFKKLYSYLYTRKNKARLLKCPALSFPFELDSNPNTKEWVVSSSPYLCLASRGFELDDTPHMWLLQKKAGKYRVLMEADGYIKIFGKSQNNYNDILAYIYLSRTTQTPEEGTCGGLKNMWVFQNGAYQLANQDYHAEDCDYKNASGAAWVKLNRLYLQKIKPRAKKLMEKFKSKQSSASSHTATAQKPAKTGLEDIISTEDLLELLKK